MDVINDLRDNILDRVLFCLGSAYSKLSFSHNIESNKFNQAKKRYGVNALSASQTNGVINSNTLNHSFEIVLTDTYQCGQELNDENRHDVAGNLFDKALSIYKDLQKNKNALTTNCLIVNEFSSDEPEYFEEEKIVILRFKLNVKYQN